MSRLSHLQLAVRAAVQNQQSDTSGEPALTPAHNLSPKYKEDENWQHVSSGDGSSAAVTAGALQPAQQSQPATLCRALYDFNTGEIHGEDSKYCLSFLKVRFSN